MHAFSSSLAHTSLATMFSTHQSVMFVLPPQNVPRGRGAPEAKKKMKGFKPPSTGQALLMDLMKQGSAVRTPFPETGLACHARAHACAHVRTRACAYTNISLMRVAHMCAHTCMRVHTCMRTRVCTRARDHVHAMRAHKHCTRVSRTDCVASLQQSSSSEWRGRCSQNQ